jgi:predicted permease
MAKKYFGDQEALGKMIRINNDQEVQVTGVLQNIPQHSSLQFSWLMPYEVYAKDKQWLQGWGMLSIRTYVQLHANTSQEQAEAKIKKLLQKNDPDPTKSELFLHPYQDVYLYSNFNNGKQDGGRIDYVRLFAIVAVFILFIACINFMNLSTARSARRSKEVGIRKVVGARRSLLISQFMGEAILLTVLSLLFALAIVVLLLPLFNSLTGKTIVIPFSEPVFILALVALAVLTGLIAGSYPALFLSAMQPIKVLKGAIKQGFASILLRKGLVIFQFALSTLLITATLAVYYQIEYIQNKNLGFDREHVISMSIEGDLWKNMYAFKQELLQLPGIKTVTRTGANPLEINASSADITWPGKLPTQTISVSATFVDYDYLSTLNIPLKAGRDFSPQFADSSSYIINETAARLMGMDDPIGQDIEFWIGKGKIVGVLKDFHTQSLHKPIEPYVLMLAPGNTWMMLIKTEPGKTAQALSSLEKLSRKYNPGYPFEYHFLDETFEKQYKSETLIGQLAGYFGCLAIFISCLGLFGLATFTAEQRTKEIGIRKVLGASVGNITLLLSTDFLKLVAIAFIIASPIAWYAMSKWLENFAFHIDLGVELFLLAGVAALLIALGTVSFQSVKAALSNPVKSLRSE